MKKRTIQLVEDERPKTIGASISKNGTYAIVKYEKRISTHGSRGYSTLYKIGLDDYCKIECANRTTIPRSLLEESTCKLSLRAYELLDFSDILYLARRRIVRTNLRAILVCILRTDTSKPFLSPEARVVARRINNQLKEMMEIITKSDILVSFAEVERKWHAREVFERKVHSIIGLSKNEELKYTDLLIQHLFIYIIM